MAQVKVNNKENYMLIVLEGFLNEDEVKDILGRIIKGIDTLTPGFTMINDISKFVPANSKVLNEIGKVQAYSMKKGVGKTIRVVGNVLGKTQLRRAQENAGVGYEVIEVGSLEEAMEQV